MKKSERAGVPPAATRTARSSATGARALPGSFGEAASVAQVFGAERWSFDDVLRRVLGFSRAAESERDVLNRRARQASSRSPKRTGSDVGTPSPAFEALRMFVRSLDPETQYKLRALSRAGREARALPGALAALAAERASGSAGASELFVEGATELQDLQRGHAAIHSPVSRLLVTIIEARPVRSRKSW